jgi:hypothetical protein
MPRCASQWHQTEFSRMQNECSKQLLHLVFGGELVNLDGTEFRDLDGIDVVGVFPDYASAHKAWKAKALATVDNAHMRYFVAHLHRLLDPAEPGK